MSPALLYFPAYLGLFAAQVLAMACNAFLDIQYGDFGIQVLLWAVAFGITLLLGWRQRGVVGDAGRRGQKWAMILGLLLTFVLFIPIWGIPRAAVLLLAAIQVAYNCVTVTRRHLHLGLLASAVMVMFAASHYRADWTMLFYLVPYVMAVVFTLVAEQINRRVQDLRRQSLSHAVVGGQWAAIVAASTAILLLGGLLYAVTPQSAGPFFGWSYGQPARLGLAGKLKDGGGAAQGSGEAGNGQLYKLASGWMEMRRAAQRVGMPAWQRSAINGLADAGEWLETTFKPTLQGLRDLMQSFKEWLEKNRDTLLKRLAVLAALMLIYGLWRLMREARVGTWLLMHLDYLRFGILALHGPGARGAHQYYAAMERVFDYHDEARPGTRNTREYLAQLGVLHSRLGRETGELTRLFEDARYGAAPPEALQIGRMRSCYRAIYRSF
ncbi:MAG: DUF4129 domain-containing protein [Sulfuricella sp.]|nr:DUF4129 domain-containing protein [Sulfuricella sp.]